MASVIRGSDNFDSSASKGLGDGQTWQDMTSSRAIGPVYTNSTGRTIGVLVNTSSVHQIAVYIAGNYMFTNGDANGYNATVFFAVPNGNTYQVTTASGSPALGRWDELR